jgi:hypothetical protein
MHSLKDGTYLTCPEWGNTERVVIVKDGIVRLVGEHKSEHLFSVLSFFSVNKIIKEII